MRRSHLIWLFAALLVWRVVAALTLPAVEDEVYYAYWARHLAWGYFDHPPLVAVQSLGTLLVAASPFALRLGTLLVASLTFFVFRALLRAAGVTERRAEVAGLMLAFGNLAGLVAGLVPTPDTGLLLAWPLALHEALKALKGEERRWLTAGLAVGLGLLSKYTMVLIGPLLFFVIWRAAPRQLKTRWPYLGALLAFLAFAPHVAWNASNEWITMRFQLRHGLAAEHLKLEAEGLPKPGKTVRGSVEERLGLFFLNNRKPEEVKKPRPKKGPFALLWQRIGDFIGGQLALWGALLLPLGLVYGGGLRDWWVARRGGAARANGIEAKRLLPFVGPERTLLLTAFWWPLIFFGAVSLVAKVETNWPGMYVIAGAALAAPALVSRYRLVALATALNALALLVLAVHSRHPFLTTRPDRDRILRETHGYDSLGRELAKLATPVYVDSYQLAAMVKFHVGGERVYQWPALARPSEFTRSAQVMSAAADALAESDVMHLVTVNNPPPMIPGFGATSLTELRDCRGSDTLHAIRAEVDVYEPACFRPLHMWYLVRYERRLPSF